MLKMIFFFQAEDGIRDVAVTGVQTCALPISARAWHRARADSARSTLGPPRPRSSGCGRGRPRESRALPAALAPPERAAWSEGSRVRRRGATGLRARDRATRAGLPAARGARA